MTETSYAAIPAGWYPDPRGTKQRRWWDGTSWTHALEAPPEPVAPAAPAYANLPGPGTPGYSNLPGPAFAAQAQRTPSPSAPTVARALDAEPSAPQHPLPTRRQLREAAALRETERLTADEPSPVYAMGPAVSSTHQPQAQQPAEQLTDHPVDAAESRAVSTVAAMTLAGAPVSATHTFVPGAPVSARPAAPVAAAPVAAAPLATAPLATAPVTPASAAAAPVATAPVAAAPATPAPIALAPVAPTATGPSQASLLNGPAYQPFGMSPKITTGTIEAPTSVNTLAVWLITVLPAVALGAAVLLIRFAPDFYTPFTQGALAFVFAIAGIALAATDRRQLTMRSHQSAASPAWILLTPLAYLIARAANTKRQAGRGWAPAVAFVLLTSAALALVYFSGLPIETFVVV